MGHLQVGSRGGVEMIVIFMVSFVMLIGATFLYMRKETSDFEELVSLTKNLQSEIQKLDTRFEELRAQNNDSRTNIETLRKSFETKSEEPQKIRIVAPVSVEIIRRQLPPLPVKKSHD